MSALEDFGCHKLSDCHSVGDIYENILMLRGNIRAMTSY